MSECKKHPGVWHLWQLHEKGPSEGLYGLYCPRCQEWYDEPQKLEVAVKAQVADDARVVKR